MMQIDIDRVLRERIPGYYRYLPGRFVKWLEGVICQKGLNELLSHNGDMQGADFARGVINDLGVTYSLKGTIPRPDNPRVILASNHPLGGLDGLVLATVAAEIFPGRGVTKFIVNDLLEFVEPLRPIFLGVNKHGAQSREKAERIEEAFAGPDPMVMFPAGLVSRRGKGGVVADLAWHKMAVVKAISSHRDIIPVHFSGKNSEFFYKFARLRTRLGIPVNLEMARLPREVFLSRGAHFTITFGSPIPWETLRGGKEAAAQAEAIRNIVYDLPCE